MKVIEGGRRFQHSTLKAELDAKIADAEREDAADPRLYDGDDWWQLNDAEQQVFDIVPSEWPRLMLTWHCYQAFSGESGTPEFSTSLIEAARQQFPQWYEEGSDDEVDRRKHFLAFASEFGGISHRDAFAVLRKQEASELRGRLLQFWDGS